MTVRREVSIYGRLDDPRSVPIQAVDNGNGTYSLAIAAASGTNIVSQPVSFTDHSGTIAVNSEAQQVMPANLSRKYLLIQNVSAIALWINFNTDANIDQPSFKLVADGSFVMEGSAIVTDSVSIIGATAGSEFTAKEG